MLIPFLPLLFPIRAESRYNRKLHCTHGGGKGGEKLLQFTGREREEPPFSAYSTSTPSSEYQGFEGFEGFAPPFTPPVTLCLCNILSVSLLATLSKIVFRIVGQGKLLATNESIRRC